MGLAPAGHRGEALPLRERYVEVGDDEMPLRHTRVSTSAAQGNGGARVKTSRARRAETDERGVSDEGLVALGTPVWGSGIVD